MIRPILVLSICALLAGCGGRDSSLNPLRWFGGDDRPRGPQTLEPEGGYTNRAENRLAVPQILSARWEQTLEGRLVVVEAIAPTKGWWDVALITETPQPAGRVRPGVDGVLRLRLVGSPPPADSADARRPAQPGPDTLTVAYPLGAPELARIDAVAISAANNTVTLRR